MSVRISYDSKTIDLLIDNEALLPNYFHKRNQNRSGSGKIETINQYGIQEMNFASIFDEDTYDDLVAWWSWARQGGLWAFAFDTGAAVSTTLSGSAAAGQKAVPVNDNQGLGDNDVCFIKGALDDKFEIVVLSETGGSGLTFIVDEVGTFLVDEVGTFVVSGGGENELTVVDNLKFSYVSGDIFRTINYWPSVVSLDASFVPKRENNYYKHLFRFAELN